MYKALLLAALLGFAAASCPNQCNGHGRCGVTDKCVCFPRWTGNDCGQRLCKEGSAWVQGGQNNAHDWAECSNKGICDRTTGECQCFDQYEGAACERSVCPNDCSGHGTCEFIEEYSTMTLADWDFNKIQGCRCDGGWEGVDCSQRKCPRGDDALTIPLNGQVYSGQRWEVSLTAGTTTDKYFYLEVVDLYGTSHRSRAYKWNPAGGIVAGSDAEERNLLYFLLDMPCFQSINSLVDGTAQAITLVTSSSSTFTFRFTLLAPARVQSITVRTDICTAGCYPVVPNYTGSLVGTSSVVAAPEALLESDECSNRGVCDRTVGQCQCFQGHYGLACQYQTVLV